MSDQTYRGYHIHYYAPPIPTRSCDWQYAHEDYDGPEDRRAGHAASEQACRDEIDWLEDDQ